MVNVGNDGKITNAADGYVGHGGSIRSLSEEFAEVTNIVMPSRDETVHTY